MNDKKYIAQFTEGLKLLKEQDIYKFYELKGIIEGVLLAQDTNIILGEKMFKFKVKNINGKIKVIVITK